MAGCKGVWWQSSLLQHLLRPQVQLSVLGERLHYVVEHLHTICPDKAVICSVQLECTGPRPLPGQHPPNSSRPWLLAHSSAHTSFSSTEAQCAACLDNCKSQKTDDVMYACESA